MGFFDKLEHGLERAVNTAFAKTFKSGLQPVEITAALRREIDTKANVVARDKVLVPNAFTITLARSDFDRMNAMGSTLINEITAALTAYASSHGYQFSGPIKISLVESFDQSVGIISLTSETVTGAVTWSGVLEIRGKRYPLKRGRTVLGRGTDVDITVDDSSISRRHVEILWDGTRAQANDLGSTNGSLLNGRKLTSAALESGNVIEMGSTSIVYLLVPEAASVQPGAYA